MSEVAIRLDLRPDHWAIVRDILERHVPDRQVVAFGSRATWTAKDYSDLDLAIMGEKSLTLDVSSALAEAFSESDLPFTVDIVDWASIDETFRNIIRRDGLNVHIPAKGSDATNRLDQSANPLGDYVGLQRGNTYKSALLGQDGPVLLGLASIARNGGFRPDNLKTYGGPSDERMLLEPGDIYVSLKDVTQSADLLGAVARVPDTISQGRLTQDTVKLNFKDEESAKTYIYWMLRTPQYRAYCKAHATGTTNLGLPRDDFLSFPIPPLMPVRRTLLQLLESLENKIDLNRRMNETLEAMARVLFKDWFVDFGPTRAKIEGREPYLAPEIWDLFPDALDDEGKPEGWEVSEIGREVDAVGGATPSTKEPAYWEEGEQHWATPKDLSKLLSPVLLDTDRKITDAGVKKITSGILPIGTVLLSSRAPIGYLAITEVPTAVNQGFIALVCEKRLPNVYVLFWCYENLDYIKSISGGSTFAEISKKAFRPVSVTIPSEEVLTAYENIVRTLYDRIVANTKESASLAQIRDLLLPKLMSGEIRLRDAEGVVERVA